MTVDALQNSGIRQAQEMTINWMDKLVFYPALSMGKIL